MRKIEHIGIAVEDLTTSNALFEQLFGAPAYKTEEVASEGVRTSFFKSGPNKIELLEATHADSPIAKFLQRRGPGLHHVAYRVADLPATLAALKSAGVRLIDEAPRPGAHGMQIAFAHPESTGGVLTEFCQPAD